MTVKFAYVRGYAPDYKEGRMRERVLTLAYELTRITTETPGEPEVVRPGVRFGWAICHPVDQFRKATGRALATKNMEECGPNSGAVVLGEKDFGDFDKSPRIAALQYIVQHDTHGFAQDKFVREMTANFLHNYFVVHRLDKFVWGKAGPPPEER